MTDDLARTAATLDLDAKQQAALDAALAAIRQRQAARQVAPQAEGGSSLFGGRARSGGGNGGGAAMQGQMRQRMRERLQQEFAAFRATLDPARRERWDTAVAGLASATRAPIWKLADGQPQQVMVRIGASDGSDTEISGNVEAGDEIITGERAAQ